MAKKNEPIDYKQQARDMLDQEANRRELERLANERAAKAQEANARHRARTHCDCCNVHKANCSNNPRRM